MVITTMKVSDSYFNVNYSYPELGYVYKYRCVHEYTFISRKMPKKRLFKAFFLEKMP